MESSRLQSGRNEARNIQRETRDLSVDMKLSRSYCLWCGNGRMSTGQHDRVSSSRVVIPAVFRPESTKKLDAGLTAMSIRGAHPHAWKSISMVKIAGMTSREMDIFFCGGVMRMRFGAKP